MSDAQDTRDDLEKNLQIGADEAAKNAVCPAPLVEYSSVKDTLIHQNNVRRYIMLIVKELLDRAEHHDETKMEPGEVEYFDQVGFLKGSTPYQSKEYLKQLEVLRPALKHHYGRNRHHPEHFKNGIRDMDVVDLVELICDWKASSMEHLDGNILLSIDVNQEKFGYGKELHGLLVNTVKKFENV